jgi:hypothetical protein
VRLIKLESFFRLLRAGASLPDFGFEVIFAARGRFG